MEAAYSLFTEYDPISILKRKAKDISLFKRRKIAPYIRRAESLTKKSEPFRKLVRDEENAVYNVIGLSFAQYFDDYINKNENMILIPREPAIHFLSYFNNMISPVAKNDDKYMTRASSIIASHSSSIDAFLKAFHSIRMAEKELDKLKVS